MQSTDTCSYSVLMSIYKQENPAYLIQALDSMLNQTVFPSEIVMVKDGPLTRDLENVLNRYDAKYPGLFNFVSYDVNHGLGYALRQGMLACSNEIVARMDTDDIARPDRMEKQLAAIDGGLDMVGSDVIEFVTSPNDPVAATDLPKGIDAIRSYSKRRNPFRHPPMTFKKSKVIEAGNYSSEFLYFEDWDLFNRMLACGCLADNLSEPLVAMRVSEDFYARRGGLQYLKYAKLFKKAQVMRGYFSNLDYLCSYLPHVVLCLMPNFLRAYLYRVLLRNR
jgi:glycosyltransferase involved in cell wall biosynthesis